MFLLPFKCILLHVWRYYFDEDHILLGDITKQTEIKYEEQFLFPKVRSQVYLPTMQFQSPLPLKWTPVHTITKSPPDSRFKKYSSFLPISPSKRNIHFLNVCFSHSLERPSHDFHPIFSRLFSDFVSIFPDFHSMFVLSFSLFPLAQGRATSVFLPSVSA